MDIQNFELQKDSWKFSTIRNSRIYNFPLINFFEIEIIRKKKGHKHIESIFHERFSRNIGTLSPPAEKIQRNKSKREHCARKSKGRSTHRRDKISGNNFPLVLFHRCIQSGLSISQIKDHPRRLATRNTDKKKLLLDFCAKVTVRNPAIFGPGLGVKSHDTFHAAIPYRTLLFANDLFHKLRDKISVQRCSVPVFWKSWKENESNRGIECIKSKRDFVQTFLSQSTTFASREILIDVRSADWPCTIDIIYRATIIPASSLSTTRFSINKYYSLHRRDKSTKFNISTLFFFSFRADFSAFFLELKLNSNSR